MNLIMLNGQGDMQIMIVDDDTWDRLNENNDKMLEMKEDECIKMFYNDMSGFAKWIKDNDAEFDKEYHGYIY